MTFADVADSADLSAIVRAYDATDLTGCVNRAQNRVSGLEFVRHPFPVPDSGKSIRDFSWMLADLNDVIRHTLQLGP